MNTVPSPFIALLKKDWRLVKPIFFVLIAFAFVFQLVTVVSTSQQNTIEFLFTFCMVMIPAAYATGSGLVLVGMEKERRTIDWLRTIPVSHSSLIWSKFVVSWITSLVVLIIVFFTQLALRLVALDFSDSLTIRGLLYPTHSVYISYFSFDLISLSLICLLLLHGAHFISWRVRAILGSLLLGLALMFAVAILNQWIVTRSELLADFVAKIFEVEFPIFLVRSNWFLAAILIVEIALLGLAGFKTATRFLSHSQISWMEESRWFRSLRRSMGTTQAATWTAPNFSYSSASALIWQYAKQNQWWIRGVLAYTAFLPILIALYAFIMLPSRNPDSSEWQDWFEAANMLTIFAALPVVCGIGISTFFADSIQHRRQFFADRGMTANRVWLTRQCVPLALVSLLCVVAIESAIVIKVFPEPWYQLNKIGLLLIASAFLIYGLAQWQSLLISHSAVSIITIPIITTGLISYWAGLIFLHRDLLLIICGGITITLLASWVGTRCWMERRQDWKFWSVQAGFAVLFVSIPVLAVLDFATGSPVPSTIVAKLSNDANQYSGLVINPIPSRIPTVNEYLRDKLGAESSANSNGEQVPSEEEYRLRHEGPVFESMAAIDEYEATVRTQLRSLLNRNDYKLAFEGWLADVFKSSALLARMRNDSATYREDIQLLDDYSERIRQSSVLQHQDSADLLDLWLIRECRHASAEANMGAELRQKIAARIANYDSRNQARRNAVLTSWQKAKLPSKDAIHFGAYQVIESDLIRIQRPRLEKRRVDEIAYGLLRCIDPTYQTDTDRANAKEWTHDANARWMMIRSVARAWNNWGRGYFSDGRNGGADIDTGVIPFSEEIETSVYLNTPPSPCALWFGKWEVAAIELAQGSADVENSDEKR